VTLTDTGRFMALIIRNDLDDAECLAGQETVAS
jgi:hypothetical protein